MEEFILCPMRSTPDHPARCVYNCAWLLEDKNLKKSVCSIAVIAVGQADGRYYGIINPAIEEEPAK